MITFLPPIHRCFFSLLLMLLLVSCKSNYSFQDVEKKNLYFVYKPKAYKYSRLNKQRRKQSNFNESVKINIEVNKLGFYSIEFKKKVRNSIFKTKEVIFFKKNSRGILEKKVFILSGLEESFCFFSSRLKNIVSCQIINDDGFYLELINSSGIIKERFRLKARRVRPWKNRSFRKHYVNRALL